jgi:hypothetical protein
MSQFVYRNACTRDAWENADPDIRQKVMDYKKLMETGLEKLDGITIDNDKENGKQRALTPSNRIADSHEYIAARGESSTADPSSQDKSVDSEDTSEARAAAKETSEAASGRLGDEDPSEGEKKSGDKSDDKGTKATKALTMGNEAASIFESAIAEAIKIKKMDSREKYAFYRCICLSPSLKLVHDRAIENLYNGAVTILRGIMVHTGWVTTLLTGGPRPSLGGNLDIIALVPEFQRKSNT